MEDVDGKIMQLVEITTKLSTQMTGLKETMDNMNGRLSTLEQITKNDLEQDMKISQIKESLARGNERFRGQDERFDKLEARVDVLERADGEKAKNAWKTIWNYVLVALASALISNIGTIIQWLQK